MKRRHARDCGDDFKDKAEVLADQLVWTGEPLANRTERTTVGHAESILKLQVTHKPVLQIFPGFDGVFHWGGAGPDGFQVRLQYRVHQPFLVLRVMIELPPLPVFDASIMSSGLVA